MAEPPFQLFGHIIDERADATLAEQVFRILLQEVQGGRWRLGERLPSIATLAQESGISRWPIHRAFEVLESKGIVRVEDRRGIYLISFGATEMKAYGVIVEPLNEPGMSFPYRHRALHEIMLQASQRNAIVEVLQLTEDVDLGTVDLRQGGPFSERVRGIISLKPFPHSCKDPLPGDRIPMVFQGPYIMESLPSVTGDTYYGMYSLTRRLIAAGHRNIALCSGSQPLLLPAVAERIRGFETACAEAGVPFNRELFNYTQSLKMDSVGEALEVLQANPDVTGWVCLANWIAQRLAMAAESIGLSVPADLSIACFGEGELIPGDSKRQLACYGPDTEAIVKACLDMLEEKWKTRRGPHSLVLIRPRMMEGHSIGLAPDRADLQESPLQAVSS